MQDSFMTIVAIFLAGILLFIFPLMAVTERSNDQAQAIVEKSLKDFVNDSATTGSITLKGYNTMMQGLSVTGNSYAVDVSVDRIGGNPGKKTTWVTGDVIGENTKFSVFTEQILNELEQTGAFSLNRGDTVNVKAQNTNKTMAEGMRSLVYSISGRGNPEITAEASAMVTASGGH